MNDDVAESRARALPEIRLSFLGHQLNGDPFPIARLFEFPGNRQPRYLEPLPHRVRIPRELLADLPKLNSFSFRMAMKQMNPSTRSDHRILKLARTVADLAECERIETPHLAEAIQYRTRETGIGRVTQEMRRHGMLKPVLQPKQEQPQKKERQRSK